MMLKLTRWAVVALMMGAGIAAHATTVTVSGTHFDVTYDTANLGLFGSLSVVGDNLFFTPNNFKASSTNGQGVVPTDSTASGLILTAHPGFQFGALSLAELGDYLLQGSASTVSVTGQLRAFDESNPFFTTTTSTITPTGAMTIADGVSHNWSANARVDNAAASAQTGSAWLSGASTVNVTIENLLTAYTATGTGPQQAFIEKKLSGVELSVTPVPLPATFWLLVSGLGALSLSKRRRAASSFV